MALALPQTQPAEEVEPLLAINERVVSSFGPYHATSRRVILVIERRAAPRVYELPYTDLESITEVRKSNQRQMALGGALAFAGVLTLFAWYLIVPIAALILGLVIAFQGSVGRPAYYQLLGRGMEGRDLYRWQVKHYGAGSFIASISEMTGLETIRQPGSD